MDAPGYTNLIHTQNTPIFNLQVIFHSFLKIVSCDISLVMTEHLTYDCYNYCCMVAVSKRNNLIINHQSKTLKNRESIRPTCMHSNCLSEGLYKYSASQGE